MTRLEALTALKEAVEAGVADMRLFGAVWPAFDDTAWRHNRDAAKAMNGSLDAARALHEAVLPGWEWRIGEDDAWLETGDPGKERTYKVAYADHHCPACAWLIAILAALIAQEQSDPIKGMPW